MSIAAAVTHIHASKELLHHMSNSSLLSVLAQVNDSAIELMIAGDYEEASTILVDALEFMETNRDRPILQVIDPLTNPVQFSDMSNFPFNLHASMLYGSPCTQTAAETVLSHVLATGTRRPGVDFIPQSDSLHSSTQSSRSGDAYSSLLLSTVRQRRRLTVGIPEPDKLMLQQTAIYCQAFVLHRDTCSFRVAAAVLAYNAGLCAHLHAAVSDTSALAPQRALDLYSSAYRSLWAEQQDQSLAWLLLQTRVSTCVGANRWVWNEQARVSVLLQAALFHNLAAVHGDLLRNFTHARLLRCHLAAVIRWTAFSQMETENCTSDRICM